MTQISKTFSGSAVTPRLDSKLTQVIAAALLGELYSVSVFRLWTWSTMRLTILAILFHSPVIS